MPDCEFQSSSSKGFLCNCCKTDSTVRRDQLLFLTNRLWNLRILFNVFCCTQPLRSTSRYARGEVIEINDFLLGTMAGGAADCSLIGSQSWWFRLGGTRVGWLPWDWPQGISKPIPIWPSILGKVVERCEKRCHDCAQVLGAPLESIMPNAWVEREGTGSAATVLRVGCVTIGGKLQRVYSRLRESYLLMWQFHSQYCASFVNPSRSDSWLSGQ